VLDFKYLFLILITDLVFQLIPKLYVKILHPLVLPTPSYHLRTSPAASESVYH